MIGSVSVGLVLGVAISAMLDKIRKRKSVTVPEPERSFPRPVKVKIPNYTGAVAFSSVRGKDINGRIVSFYTVEHDEPFPFVKADENGVLQPMHSRRKSFMHGDWVEEL